MKVVFTVDVEEQGLFSGRYQRIPTSVDNVQYLTRLEEITRQFNLPLTLLVTYPVIKDPACQNTLLKLKEESGAEIGAHLHPWNTPPFSNEGPNILRSASMPPDTLAAKLSNLVGAISEATGQPPVSFRMGRFDFSDSIKNALRPAGLRVDSSAIPLQATPAGIDHFLGKTDPYWLQTSTGPILEAPPTMAQIVPGSARAIHALIKTLPQSLRGSVLKCFKMIGRVGVQPMGFPLASLKAGALLHQRRGGQILTIYLHSSELTHGHHPKLPDQAATTAYLHKITSFLDWLSSSMDIHGCTLADLLEDQRLNRLPGSDVSLTNHR